MTSEMVFIAIVGMGAVVVLTGIICDTIVRVKNGN